MIYLFDYMTVNMPEIGDSFLIYIRAKKEITFVLYDEALPKLWLKVI